VLKEFLRKKKRSPEEKRLIELLTLPIEDFEQKHYRFENATPVDILRHLVEANRLRRADLVDVFGTPSIVSEVLHGKWNLAMSHIVKLSKRFGVSPALFIEKPKATSNGASTDLAIR
jgi:HTH-type transcriptional regulator/antitoxin HigA